MAVEQRMSKMVKQLALDRKQREDDALAQQLFRALLRERFSEPVEAAKHPADLAYHRTHTKALQRGCSEVEAQARGQRAFWVVYFDTMAEEATWCAKNAREAVHEHGDDREERDERDERDGRGTNDEGGRV
jgi:hypothetical protein